MTVQHKRHPLHGAWAKYEQAAHHSERYQGLFKSFIASNAFSVTASADTDADDRPSLGRDDVWHELSCAIGDAIHNLRSALDHVAYAVALQRVPEEKIGRLYFTIRSTRQTFDKAVKKKPVCCMGDDWTAFLLSVQPFQGPPYSQLARVNELDIIDKHKLLFGLRARSDVYSRRDDGEWVETSLDLSDGLVQMPTHETAFVTASHFLSLPDSPPNGGKPLPVEADFLEFYVVVGDVIRAAQARFFSEERT